MDIELEPLTYPNKLLMFERGIRGGIAQAVHRYAKASNKYMGDNPRESSYLQHLNVNNLYDWPMSQLLPTRRFEWVDQSQFTPDNISLYAKEGYLLEVNIRYPTELHDLHNDFPFMCEKMVINRVEKLVPNLDDKKKYIIQVKMLDQALKHGLILEKVHRAIRFNQRAWLKPYIDFNTQLRFQARNESEKDFFKLMNNSAFGKTMENIRKHKDIKLATNREAFLKTVMKPNFESAICFSENLMGCAIGKIKVIMNKPVYLGKALLGLGKLIMYEFHYDYVVPNYPGHHRRELHSGMGTAYGLTAKLCYMDTDSLVYHIKMENFYADIAGDVYERFDTSQFDSSDARPLPLEVNKNVVRLMKDELGGKIMTKFVAMRPKLYAYRKLDNKEDTKCKGIKKCFVKHKISFDDYKNCLFDSKSKSIYISQLMFKNNRHEVHMVEVNRVAINRDDNKRIVKKDGIRTLAHGHCSLG